MAKITQQLQIIFSINLLFFLFIFSSLQAQKYEHLIMYGQSLSTGTQSWPSLSTDNIQGNFMIGSQVWTNFGNIDNKKLYPLVANVAQSVSTLPKTRASSIYAECPLIGATNYIKLKTNDQTKYIASSCGTGGKSIEELSKEYYNNGSVYGWYRNTISYAAAITENNIHCPVIFWMQGEFNYAPAQTTSGLTQGSKPTSNKQEYKALLLKLKENMQSEIINKYNQNDVPLFITYQAGVQYTRGKTLEIGMAQLEASNESPDVVCAGPVYPMTDRGGHLDPNGYRWFGEILGKVYYRTKILGQDFKPLQPMEISRTENPRILKIKFIVPKLPLILDELTVNKVASYGFEIYDNNVKRTIENITINGDCVYISTTTDMVGNVEVVYAGPNNLGHGNLRDSDDEAAFYNYIDLDKKNHNRTYVYEREATETTLRPSYEPKDAQGVIYDKPYPLYNFSVAFYYKLDKDSSSYKVPYIYNSQTGISYSTDNSNIFYQSGLTLIFENPESRKFKIEFFDSIGHLTTVFKDNDGLNKLIYRLDSFSKGIYIAKLTINNKTKGIKISL